MSVKTKPQLRTYADAYRNTNGTNALTGATENVMWNDVIDTMALETNVAATVVSTATYTVLSTDRKLHVTYTATGACTITIPTALITSTFELLIKDTGNASTNNITVIGQGGELFDGSASAILVGDYDSISIYSDGTNLFLY